MVEILRTIGLVDANTRFPDLCQEIAESGEAVIIARRGEPWIEVRPARGSSAGAKHAPPPRGILDCLHECQARFGPLLDEFDFPERTSSPLPHGEMN